MTIEHAVVRIKPKPWGSLDLRPWSEQPTGNGPIGELWFERPDLVMPQTALLLKLLFTTESLSIQVHPDDAFAHSIGLANGKTEAWYVLSAVAGAEVAVGLAHPVSRAELRSAAIEGSIADLLHWRPVHRGDFFFIPAGTIHAIGAGIVIAEIQQQSDATFRLFDYGRKRDLHIEDGVAATTLFPDKGQPRPEWLNDGRLILTVNPYFVLEKIDLVAGSLWAFDATKESWLLAIEGRAQLGVTTLGPGDVAFLQAENVDIDVGAHGFKALLAYVGPDVGTHALTRRYMAHGVWRAQATPRPAKLAALTQLETPAWPS